MSNGKTDARTRNVRSSLLRARFLANERRLAAGLQRIEREATSGPTSVADMVEAACESAQNDLLAYVQALRSTALAENDEAYQRLAEGTYGRCEDCGQRISVKRLRAVPAVSLCLGCERTRERRAESPLNLPEWSGTQVVDDAERPEAFSGQARRRF